MVPNVFPLLYSKNLMNYMYVLSPEIWSFTGSEYSSYIYLQGSKLAGARVPEAPRFSAGHRDFRDSVPGWHCKNLGLVYVCKYPGTRILGGAPRFFTLSARMALAKNHLSSSPVFVYVNTTITLSTTVI